jgi:hypothetical protein
MEISVLMAISPNSGRIGWAQALEKPQSSNQAIKSTAS